MIIKLELTVGQVNYIIAALGQRPHHEVHELILEIKKQGDSQTASQSTVAAA